MELIVFIESLLFMNFLFSQKSFLFFYLKINLLNFCRLDGAIQGSYKFFLTISLFYIPYPFYSLLLAILRFRIEFSSRCALSSWRAIYKVSGKFWGIFLLLEDFELKSISVLSSPGGVSEYCTQITRSKQTRGRSSFSFKIL